MMGYTHSLIALLIGEIISVAGMRYPINSLLIVLFALLPDLDQPHGILSFILRPVSYFLHENFGHRTLTHSIWALDLGVGLLAIVNPALGLLFLIGYGSHIVLDMLTYSGVRLFYPSEWELNILDGPFMTGGTGENLLFLAAVAVTLLLEVLRGT